MFEVIFNLYPIFLFYYLQVMVFFSTCDSVDFHALLFRETEWPLDLDAAIEEKTGGHTHTHTHTLHPYPFLHSKLSDHLFTPFLSPLHYLLLISFTFIT